jgi:orotidine-5'-phosphate decarboxylase
VAQAIVDEVAERNAGAEPLGPLGVVAGVTIEPDVLRLDALNGPILAPGVGAQGGTAADVRRLFGGALRNVLPTVSREVLRHGPAVPDLRAAAERFVEEFAFLRG